MSLPIELREQLLSGYLDDALTVDERMRVEQLLADDAEFAAELKELREIRSVLKSIAADDADVKLDAGFADRVLDAAVARAQSEGLSEEHPLLRLAEQPSLSGRRRSFDWRIPASIAALAACIALAIFVVNGNDDPNLVVENTDDPVESPDTDPSMYGPDSSMLADDSAAPERNDGEPIDEASDGVSLEPSPETLPSTPEMIANRGTGSSSDVEIPETSIQTGNDVPAIASTQPAATGELSPENQMLLGGSPIMVYAVRMTDLGKQNEAVQSALEGAQIGAARREELGDDVASFIKNSNKTPEKLAKARVLFLQAPLKSLDRFYLNLMEDEEGIASVGMNIAFNAPLGRVADLLAVDPTTVKHDGRVIELMASPVVSQIASELDDLQFNFNRDLKSRVQNDGPDEMGRVLLLILP